MNSLPFKIKINMKKICVIIILCISFLGCKNDTASKVNLKENRAKSYDQNDGLITIRGEFLYDETIDAAIIQKDESTIYSVVVNDNMHVLNEQVKPLKKDIYDMVIVTIRGKRIKNTDQNSSWPYKVEIEDILKVEASSPDKQDVVKLEK